MIDSLRLAEMPTHCIVCGNNVPAERTRFKSTTCSEEHSKLRKAQLRRGDRSAKCVVCTKDIGADRARYTAITCSTEHSAIRKASIRARVDRKRCRHCQRPATPVEQAAFRRFRSLELTRPDIVYPAAFKRWTATGGDLAGFGIALQAAFAQESDGADLGLELVDRRSREAPGGAKSGRPQAQWKGGREGCVHVLRVRRENGKPIPAALSNVCRRPGCGAIRVGMEAKEWRPNNAQ